MGESVSIAPEFPGPDIIANFYVCADEHNLLLKYNSNDSVVIVSFLGYEIYKFGSPNDEAIAGHPLYEKGLQPYAAQKVQNSNWIKEMEIQNSVHHLHKKELFIDGMVHYIFSGQDRTFECIVYKKPDRINVSLFDENVADEMWIKIRNEILSS